MRRTAFYFVLLATPAAAQLYGLTPVVSAGAVDHLIAKAAPGTALKISATNFSSTAGFLVGYNATSNPSDGALTASLVIDCVALPANGTAIIDNQPGPGTNYSAGIVVVLTSATSCYTKTTGTVSGFISAKVQ
ncbi:hypothetical+protein [Methylocapsa aurea]|uniref:hypothetical protein n=1 Tax=Methylocapsa aurea TaxID=663610 RepID=UPI003D18CB99